MYFIILAIITSIIVKLYPLHIKSTRNITIKIDFKKAYELKSKKPVEFQISDIKIPDQKYILSINKIDKKTLFKQKTYIDGNGYQRFINSNRLVSRYVMEKKLGRRLKKEEIVHHIDGDKLNNRLSNLMLFPNQNSHHQYHLYILHRYGSWHEWQESKPKRYTVIQTKDFFQELVHSY